MKRTLPLVIADEAHHWRNETAGVRSFMRYFAPFTHRLLLLTATPFQLCHQELEEILKRADGMRETIGNDRVEKFQILRQLMLSGMEESEVKGQAFSKAWGRLANDLRAVDATPVCRSPDHEADWMIARIDHFWNQLCNGRPLEEIPGRLRSFFSAAGDLRRANLGLGDVMRKIILRHRRESSVRRYCVGHEYPPSADPMRPDQHQLHPARGRSLPPETELAQFLLMKVVASATRGRHKTALGISVTGAYSTLWRSEEGKKALKAAGQNESPAYFKLLQRLTGGENNARDEAHPKLQLVVKRALDCWEQDEKTLIFCFRVPTAEALFHLISSGIEKRLNKARRVLLSAWVDGRYCRCSWWCWRPFTSP